MHFIHSKSYFHHLPFAFLKLPQIFYMYLVLVYVMKERECVFLNKNDFLKEPQNDVNPGPLSLTL